MNKHLKLKQRNYVGYNGMVGRFMFKDGISVEPVPPIDRIRIAANFSVVELEEDGSEGQNPSPSHTTVLNTRTRAEARGSLPRQTEAERQEEDTRLIVGAEKIMTLLSRTALEKVASESGIAGLRVIAADWDVRSKSIPVLMQMILDAQDAHIALRREAMAKRGVPAEEIDRLLTLLDEAPAKVETTRMTSEPKPEPKPEPTPNPAPAVDDGAPTVAQAAATGDMAAAINVPEDKPQE